MPPARHVFMNARYPRLELHTGKNGAMEYCDLARAAVKTQTSMQRLFNGLKKSHGNYKTRKFRLIDRTHAEQTEIGHLINGSEKHV